MKREQLIRLYFRWLCDQVVDDLHYDYDELLWCLYNIEFIYDNEMDQNRAADGVNLRMSYINDMGLSRADFLYFKALPCSMLEMMISLSKHISDTMDDYETGEKTHKYFWYMVKSLGLDFMYDDEFDPDYVKLKIEKFIKKDYCPNGKGSLFYVKNATCDMRKLQIWIQACTYMDQFTEF